MDHIIIVACDQNGGIGKNNKIPWYIPPDLKYFKAITTSAPEGMINAVIMGRKTWESIGSKPLPNRINVIISNTLSENEKDIIIAKSFDHAHLRLQNFNNINKIFVIGGESIYKSAIYDLRYTKLYLTYIYNIYDCDASFPINVIKQRYKITMESEEQKTGGDIVYKYLIYEQ